MADENLQYHLAVSLHAADDGLRDQLVPANRGVGVVALLAAADEYFAKTGPSLTFEYVLLGGVNDGADHARQLIARLRGRPALVNVIPYNPVAGLPFAAPRKLAAERFAAALVDGGLTVHVRRRKGAEIEAACGQLSPRRGDAAAVHGQPRTLTAVARGHLPVSKSATSQRR